MWRLSHVMVSFPAVPNPGSQTCHPMCIDNDEDLDILADHIEDRGATFGCYQMKAEIVLISIAWELPQELACRLATILRAMPLAEALETIDRLILIRHSQTDALQPVSSWDGRASASRLLVQEH